MSEYNSMKDIAVEFENCKEDLEYFQNKNDIQEEQIHKLEDELLTYKKLVYDILLSLECDKEIRNLVNKGLFIEEGECIRPYCDEVGKYPIN
jgi:hypothetical protein